MAATDFKLPVDSNSAPIQAVCLSDTRVSLSVSSTTGNAALPSGSTAGQVIRVALEIDSYIRFGTSGVTVSSSTGHLFPAGVEILVVPKGATHIAFIAADGASSGNGTVSQISYL